MRRIQRLCILILLLSLGSLDSFLVGNSPAIPQSSPAAQIGGRPGHRQFGLAGSGSVVVWEDRLALDTLPPLRPGDLADPTMGSSDVYGLDLATGRSLAIADGPGDQTAPAVSGSLVVWEDSRASCPACQLDIYGKDLATNTEFPIATGPADQTRPAVFGRTVVWVEADASGSGLLGKDLDAPGTFEIARMPAGSSILRPAISADLVVWAEISPSPPYTLYAYDRARQRTTAIATIAGPPLEYAVDGYRVVWTDPELRFADLKTGEAATLAATRVSSPSIAGDRVVWSATTADTDTGLDVYGLSLDDRAAGPLVVSSDSQLRAVVAGDRLVWQNSAATGSRLISEPLRDALAHGPQQLAAARRRALLEATGGATFGSPRPPANAPATTPPAYKGVHTAIGGGWNVAYDGIQQPCADQICPALDALGPPNSPFFGSYVVIDFDLDRNTGRDTPLPGMNPSVADWMSYYQSTYGSRVVVRTYPTIYPKPTSQWYPKTPNDVAQQVIDLVREYGWIENIQVNNEPNLSVEWPDICANADCVWTFGGQTRTARWTDYADDRKYTWIDQFYVDAWFAIDFYEKYDPDPALRARLAAMHLWAPPMGEIYQPLDTGAKLYTYLQGMLTLYGRMTYHTYPTPNFDADGSGGLINSSWTWFSAWVQDRINAHGLPTIITEFGWNPDQMNRADCVANGAFPPGGMTQATTWPATGAAGCKAADNVEHRFEDDLDRFLLAQRHGAEAVDVWIVRGWNNRADGITPDGTVLPWLYNYQRGDGASDQ